MRRFARLAAGVSALSMIGAGAAHAQSAPAAGWGRIEASFGGMWLGNQPLGRADANETTPTGGALKIFTSSSELARAAGVEGRIAVRVLGTLEAEVQGSYAVPQLKVALSSDSEAAPNVTAIEKVQQFTFGGGAVWYLPTRALGTRLVPFVTGGLGQLRQMHQDRVLLETGRYFQVGGGVKGFLVSRSQGFINGLGVRLDVQALVRRDGVAFDDRGHASPSVGASAFVRF